MTNKSSDLHNSKENEVSLTPFLISELVLKFIKGEISSEQQSLLEQWRVSSQRNEELFKKCIDSSSDERFIENYFADIDFMPYYKECCKFIDTYSLSAHRTSPPTEIMKSPQSRRNTFSLGQKLRTLKVLKFAAVLLIPLVISAIFLLKEGDLLFNGRSMLSFNDDITPGSPSAVLVLAGGERVVLGRDAKSDAVKPDNIIIENDTIKYTQIAQKEREYNTVIVPRGGEFVIQLSDGTKVWLNAESELRYPVSFGDGERGVYLTGEAYFQVERSELHPFTVTSGDHRITVLGTEFCIRAYRDENKILTTLEKGKVSVNSGMESIQLNPGQQSSVEGSTIKVESVNTEIYTAWRDKRYIFQEQTLEDILNTLSRWYNMKVSFDEDEIKNYKFTGELMKYSDIREFLKKLEDLEKVSFKIDGQEVNVTRYAR